MASDNDVEEIKNRLDIVDHISEYVALKRSGSNYKGVCPFHGEKTPSFMVSPDKQIFHCFGCGEGGDAISFTMKYEGLSFPEALELLARKVGIELKRSRRDSQSSGIREALRSIQNQAQEFYAEHLKKNPQARKYIIERGINEESLEKFKLGYSPPGWHNMMEFLKKRGHKMELITKSGLVAEGQKGPYDIFRGRIMYPITDLHGQCIAFGGRVMDGSEPKYLNSPDTELFHKGDNLYALSLSKEGIRADGHAVIVEGYMDAIMCHQYGIASAVAPLGTALTEGHLKKLKRYTEKLVLIFDGDKAGLAAARRSLDLIMVSSMSARVLVLPEGADPDSILNEKGEAHMRGLIDKESLSPVEFVLSNTEQEFAARECATMIAKATDPLVRDQLVLEMADKTRINETAIREKLAALKGGRKFSNQRSSAGGKPGTAPRRKPLLKAYNEEILLLSAVITDPKSCAGILERLDLQELDDPIVRTLLTKISDHSDMNAAGILDLAESDEEREVITRLSMEPGFEADDLKTNIDDCILKITRRRIDVKIKEAEQAGDLKTLQKLIQDRQSLLKGNEGA